MQLFLSEMPETGSEAAVVTKFLQFVLTGSNASADMA